MNKRCVILFFLTVAVLCCLDAFGMKTSSKTIYESCMRAAQRGDFKFVYEIFCEGNVHESVRANAELICLVHFEQPFLIKDLYKNHGRQINQRTINLCHSIAFRKGHQATVDEILKYFKVDFSVEEDLPKKKEQDSYSALKNQKNKRVRNIMIKRQKFTGKKRNPWWMLCCGNE